MAKSDDIRKIFDGHIKKLLEEKKQMGEKISQWRNKCVRQIDEYVTEEKKYLEQECEKQKRSIEARRDQYMRDAATQDKKKCKEVINQLLGQCKDFQFQIAALEYYSREIEFVQVMTEDRQKQTNRNERSVDNPEEKQAPKTGTKDHDNNVVNNETENRNSSPQSASANSTQTNRRPSLTQTTPDHDHSTNGDDDSKPDAKSGNDSTEKCPICFMIFPQSMIKSDREQHVNEHYADD